MIKIVTSENEYDQKPDLTLYRLKYKGIVMYTSTKRVKTSTKRVNILKPTYPAAVTQSLQITMAVPFMLNYMLPV